MMLLISLLIFLMGLLVGSFFNVLIQRLPKYESIISPRPNCLHCERQLSWYELIPVLGYVLQKGVCRECGSRIPLLYPFIEILTGIIYASLYLYYGLSVDLVIGLLFISLLIPIVVIDLQHQIIPDKLNMAGAILGIAILPLANITWLDAGAGALVGGGIMLVIAIVTRGGMGGGDIKMMAMMGLFLGWKLTLVALFFSFIISGVVSLILIMTLLIHRKDFIPFGLFLASGGIIALVFGTKILTWYLSSFSGV